MPIDWNAIAQEVDEALRSVSDVSQPNGYPATLRVAETTIPDPPEPWNEVTTTTDHTVYVIEGVREIRDINGTTILQTLHTLTVSATGQAPAKGQMVAVGIKAEDADNSSPWHSILEVRPLAPAGIAVLYEVDISG